MIPSLPRGFLGFIMEVVRLLTGACWMLMAVSSSTSGSTFTTPSFSSTVSRRTDEVTFNTHKLQELGSRGQWLLRHMAVMAHSCGVKDMPNLRRKLLPKSEVTCNDGSPPGYYIRRSHGSDKWIVFLEGGWYCFDLKSCSDRFSNMPQSMSSNYWPKFRVGSGILSLDPEENPYYFHSNVVYIPYCSSDSWSGTRNKTSDLSFMGSLILEKVFNELLKKRMKKAKSVIVAGTSAGGTGVLINLDRIADQIHARDPKIEVKGLVDSGWFLDNESFKNKPCINAFTCSPMAGIQKGAQVWEPRLPVNCTSLYPKEIWRCFFGHRVYASIKTPIYIIQNLYDAAQIAVNNIFEEKEMVHSQLSPEQWRYLLKLGEEVKDTLQNASAVFAPACISHEILTKPEWHTVRIDGTSLPQSIHCWDNNHSVTSSCRQTSIKNSNSRNNTPLSDSPRHNQNRRRRRRKGKQKGRNKKRKNKNMNGETNRNSRSVAKRCQHKLIDTCPWPHCNCSCPKCQSYTMTQANQFFLQKLASEMGIDPAKMANVRLCGY